jgi:DNA-binding LacI/PurR family transcriptional regulator
MPSEFQNHGDFRSTIKDVAREAGVSVASVSRALNNPQRVSSAMVEKVRRVAEAL